MTTILLVEDEYLERLAIRHILENVRPDYEIVGEADNGKDAVELALTLEPDIILMDIRMPIMSGIEATKEINQKINTNIIFLTAHDEFEYAREGIRLNVNDYLLKPIRKEKLLSSIDEAVKSSLEFQETSDHIEFSFMRNIQAANITAIHDDIHKKFHKISNSDHAQFRRKVEDDVIEICGKVDSAFASQWRRSIDELRKIRAMDIWIYSMLWLIDQMGMYFYEDRKETEGGDLELSTQFIELHLREKLTLSKVASEMGFSSSYYSRIFKKEYGKNLTEYIQSRRIIYGEILLRNTNLTVNEIADDCGFNEANYFSRVFKEHTNLSPSEFQNKIL